MDASGWIKNDHREMRIYQSLYFQIAFKMYHISNHDNVALYDRYSSKQNWIREKHLNKQMVQSL